MRGVLRSALFGTTAFTLSLILSSCGSISNPQVSKSTGNSGTGPVPTVSGLAVEVNGVAPNRRQEVQFGEAMNPATINASTFLVTEAGGNAVPGAVTYDPDYNVAIFQPNPALQTNTPYTATITTGAQSVGGKPLAANYSYQFTTRANTDSSPISVKSVVPAANAQCISSTAPIAITFNEAPDASTVTAANIVVTDSNGNKIPVTLSVNISTTQVVVNPKSPLPSGSITVTVSNIGDLADQMMQKPFTWTFSTACNTGGGGSGSGAGPATADVYVDTGVPSTANTTIHGWTALADGTLVPVSGSPYNGNGASSIGVAQNFLFGAGTAAASDVGTWDIQSDGSLTVGPVNSTPPQGTASEGPLSLSFDLTQKDLYANYSINGTYQAYTIGSNGSLSYIDYVGADESSSWLSFTANDAMAYQSSCYHGTPAIYGYARTSSGGLSIAYDPTQPPQPSGTVSGSYCPWGAATLGNSNVIIAEVPVNDYSETGPWQLVNFAIASDGSLSTADTATTAATVNVGEVNDYRVDPTQTWLAVGGTTGLQIFHWVNGKLSPAGTVSIPNGVHDLRWDNAGHLFVLAGTPNQSTTFYVFNVVQGVPTPAPGSPVPLTGFAYGLAVKPLS